MRPTKAFVGRPGDLVRVSRKALTGRTRHSKRAKLLGHDGYKAVIQPLSGHAHKKTEIVKVIYLKPWKARAIP